MSRRTFFDRISFPTEYNTKEELKSSIVLLFLTCLLFFILSSAMIIFDLFMFSKTLLLGTIAYELILFYMLDEYVKKFIQAEIKREGARKTLKTTSSVIFSALMLLTLLTLVYTMVTPTPVVENKFISLTIPLILIVLPTFFWHELVMFFKKKFLGKIKLLGLFFLILAVMPSLVQAQEVIVTNQSGNQTVQQGGTDIFSKFSSGVSFIEKGVDFFNKIKTFITDAQSKIQAYLNLTPEQIQIITIVAILIGVFLLLKFLSVIVKWIIVILIIWIIAQLIFL